MKKELYTVRELEETTGENIEEVLQDYIESCARTGHLDPEENINYFIRENDLKKSEYGFLYELYLHIENS